MTTPARRQYLRIKKEHQGEILLFRMGDFFETFDDDARIVSRELEIALTSREMGRGQRIPLAGIPYHALDNYLARLVKKGYKVAICEQTSDPATSRGLVDREVVRVVTPGTVFEDSLLQQKAKQLPRFGGRGGGRGGTGLCRHKHRRVRHHPAGAAAGGGRDSPACALGAARTGGGRGGASDRDRGDGHARGTGPLRSRLVQRGAAGPVWRLITGGLRVRRSAPGGPVRGSDSGIPVQEPEGRADADHLPSHLLHRRIHGPGPADPPQSGAVSGWKVGREQCLSSVGAGPHQDRHGGPAAKDLAGTAPVGPRRSDAAAGGRCVVPPERPPAGADRVAAGVGLRRGAAHWPGTHLRRRAAGPCGAGRQPRGHAAPQGDPSGRRRLGAGALARRRPVRHRRRRAPRAVCHQGRPSRNGQRRQRDQGGVLLRPGFPPRLCQGRPELHSGPGAEGARQDGHQVAEGRLQQGLRLLHRGEQGEIFRWCRRSTYGGRRWWGASAT